MTVSMETQTIFQCLEDLPESSDERQSLYHEWQSKLIENKINVEARSKNEEWVQRCFEDCEGERRTHESDKELYEDLLQRLSLQVEHEKDTAVRWKLQTQLAGMQAHAVPGDWIQRAYMCVTEEKKLVEKFSKANRECMFEKEPSEQLYAKVEKARKNLGEKLKHLDAAVKDYKQAKEKLDDNEERIQRCQPIFNLAQSGGLNGINGTQSIVQQAQQVMDNARENVKQKFQRFMEINEILKPDLDAVYKDSHTLIERLVDDLKLWQHELKLKHAELYAEVDLKKFAPWCAKAGQVVRDVLTSVIPRLQNAWNDVLDPGSSDWEPVYKQFRELLTSFCRRTFVVTQQDSWNVKKNIMRPAMVNLRMLAADTYEGLGGVAVHAIFVKEHEINSCYNQQTGQLDLNKLKENSLKFKKGQSAKFIKQSDSSTEAVFSNIEVCLKLTRTKMLQVFEEKYRLVFYTQLGTELYWTVSMPMVVTTGASQQCPCLASIMWQCFSTDVFTLPIEPVADLPWTDVGKMLHAKIKNLPSHRCLTDDNIKHLKARLLGTADMSDSTTVTLHQFCNTNIKSSKEQKKADFTFWEWFLSLYNVIRMRNVVKFWENGWIEGFLGKEAAEKKLKDCSCNKSGFFLLRFSDWNIRRSQGKDAVYGYIATTVSVHCNGVMKVIHLDLIGYDDLKELPLANILLQTAYQNKAVYRYLYPDTEIPSAELFKHHLTLGRPIPGYTGVEKAFVASLEKLEQDFIKLEVGGKRAISAITETQDNTYFTPTCINETISGPKKVKIGLANLSFSDMKDMSMGIEKLKSGTLQDAIHANTAEVDLYTFQLDPLTPGQLKTASPKYNQENQSYLAIDEPGCLCPSPQDINKTKYLPTVITDTNGNIPSSSGDRVRIEPTVLQENSIDHFAGCHLQEIPVIGCLISQAQHDNVGRNSNKPVNTLLQSHEQESKNFPMQHGPLEEMMANSLRVEGCALKPTGTVADKNLSGDIKTLEMIKTYLADMTPELILKAIPADKVLQLMAPCLEMLPPEWKSKVFQNLKGTILKCQSDQGTMDNFVCGDLSNQSQLSGENNEYCDLNGLNLRSPEIVTGLSMSETDVDEHLTDLEQVEAAEKIPMDKHEI